MEEAFETLSGQIAAREHANLLKAPIDGTVTFTEYWSENQHVRAGDVVMTIVPDASSSLLASRLPGKVRLPIQESGKVEVVLPEGLTTSYGLMLPFTQEMQGTADIVTDDIRLFERFFQPIQALLHTHLS